MLNLGHSAILRARVQDTFDVTSLEADLVYGVAHFLEIRSGEKETLFATLRATSSTVYAAYSVDADNPSGESDSMLAAAWTYDEVLNRVKDALLKGYGGSASERDEECRKLMLHRGVVDTAETSSRRIDIIPAGTPLLSAAYILTQVPIENVITRIEWLLDRWASRDIL